MASLKKLGPTYSNHKRLDSRSKRLNLTYPGVLGICPDPCLAVCVNPDPVFCLLRYCQTHYHHLQDSRCLVCRARLGTPRGIPGETRDPCPVPKAFRDVVPSLG